MDLQSMESFSLIEIFLQLFISFGWKKWFVFSLNLSEILSNIKNNVTSKLEFNLEKKAILRTSILMLIYFTLIFYFAGYVNQPNNHAWKENLEVVLFQNIEFNFNLILMICSEIILFSYLSKDVKEREENNKKAGKGELYNGFFRQNEKEKNESSTKDFVYDKDDYYLSAFSIQMIVLHISIIFGVLSYRSSNKSLYTFTNHIGAATELIFMLVFVALQIVGEFLDFTVRKK